MPRPVIAQDAAEDILREQVELVLHGMIGQSEVYVMLDGWGTLLTSSRTTNPTETRAGDVVGPTFSADAVGGTVREIHGGDIVVIPAGTLHAWTSIPDHVTYLSIRPDPHGVLPEGYVRDEIR